MMSKFTIEYIKKINPKVGDWVTFKLNTAATRDTSEVQTARILKIDYKDPMQPIYAAEVADDGDFEDEWLYIHEIISFSTIEPIQRAMQKEIKE